MPKSPKQKLKVTKLEKLLEFLQERLNEVLEGSFVNLTYSTKCCVFLGV